MGNPYEAISTAFANDAATELVRYGASAEGAFGNDVAATFNLGMGLSKWVTAVGGGGRQHVFILGDSNVEHQPANTFRWAQQLRTDLGTFTGLTLGGEGFRQLGLIEFAKTGGLADLSLTDVAGTSNDLGPYGKAFALGNTTSPLITWTKPGVFAAHDRFEIYGTEDDFIAQQGEYSVDGGAFNSTGWDFAPTLGNRLVKNAVVSTVTSTLRLRPANAFPTTFAGVAFYQGTSGLVVHNLALFGTTITDASGVNNAQRLAIFDDLQPKLTIVWTGTNEQQNWNIEGTGTRKQMSLDQFYRDYSKVAAKARQYGDCLIVFPHAFDTSTNNILYQQPVPRQIADFDRVARKIAYEKDCGYISMHALWGPWARHNARGFASDGLHLSQAGHGAAFKFISRAIRRVS